MGQQGWGVSQSRTGRSRVQGNPVGCGDHPHYRPSVGDAGLVEIIGVFEGDNEGFG